MSVQFKILAAGLALIVSTSVMAENYYAALDLGQSKGSDICTGLPAGVSGCEDTGTAYRIAGGYQITPNWAAEVSYADYGSGSQGSGNLGGVVGYVSGTWKATAIEIAGVGTLPISGSFSLTGKIGLASTDIKSDVSSSLLGDFNDSASNTKLSFGIGARFDVNPNVAIRAQYENFGTVGDANSTGTTKLTMLSVGALVKF
jgi:OmpA-OmpF porin, OOP family